MGRIVSALAIAVMLAACNDSRKPPSAQTETDGGLGVSAQDRSGLITLTGVRHSKGNAVDCPEIRTDDGRLHPVKGLTADIAIGDRVTLRGAMGVSTTCKGRVLIVESIERG